MTRPGRGRVVATGPGSRVRVGAPAKINLDLRVLGRRADGYHDVRTILQSVALHDVVSLTARPGPLLVWCRQDAVPRGSSNLVWTAARLLWQALDREGQPRGVSIGIVKRVPVAAGLGGASSNAASVLRVLGRWWSAPPTTLRTVAATVGSDVPFFLKGGTVLATGRGERTRTLPPLPRYWVVLARPGFGVSTPAAYAWWDRDRPVVGPVARPAARWRHQLHHLANDLEASVVRRHPEIGEMVDRLRVVGAEAAAMTGSGSTVFGLFGTRAGAVRARRRVRRRGWRTWLTRTVGPAELARLATPACMD